MMRMLWVTMGMQCALCGTTCDFEQMSMCEKC